MLIVAPMMTCGRKRSELWRGESLRMRWKLDVFGVLGRE